MLLAETMFDYIVTRAGYMLLGTFAGVLTVMFLKAIRKNERRINGLESRLETLEGGSVANPLDSPGG